MFSDGKNKKYLGIRVMVLAGLLMGGLILAEEPFNYFHNDWNVVSLTDYNRGTRISTNNGLVISGDNERKEHEDDVTARIKFGNKLTPLTHKQAKTNIDGISLLPLFRGEILKRQEPMYFCWYGAFSKMKIAIRHGDWKLLTDGKSTFELYNLAVDIGEKNNLFNADHTKAKEMKKYSGKYITRSKRNVQEVARARDGNQ